MDPDEALRAMRELSAAAESGEADLTEELATKFRELDEWLKVGGFLPKAWER